MHPTSPKSLEDVATAADLVVAQLAGRTFDDYVGDRGLRYIVERSFEIMGEALRRIERRDPVTAASIADYRKMIDFRNVLAHGYDTVDHRRVWAYIQNDLPSLRERVGELLGEAEAEERAHGDPGAGR